MNAKVTELLRLAGKTQTGNTLPPPVFQLLSLMAQQQHFEQEQIQELNKRIDGLAFASKNKEDRLIELLKACIPYLMNPCLGGQAAEVIKQIEVEVRNG